MKKGLTVIVRTEDPKWLESGVPAEQTFDGEGVFAFICKDEGVRAVLNGTRNDAIRVGEAIDSLPKHERLPIMLGIMGTNDKMMEWRP